MSLENKISLYWVVLNIMLCNKSILQYSKFNINKDIRVLEQTFRELTCKIYSLRKNFLKRGVVSRK